MSDTFPYDYDDFNAEQAETEFDSYEKEHHPYDPDNCEDCAEAYGGYHK